MHKDIDDVIYIGTTCFLIQKCLSRSKTKSKPRVNWKYDDDLHVFHYQNVCLVLKQKENHE